MLFGGAGGRELGRLAAVWLGVFGDCGGGINRGGLDICIPGGGVLDATPLPAVKLEGGRVPVDGCCEGLKAARLFGCISGDSALLLRGGDGDCGSTGRAVLVALLVPILLEDGGAGVGKGKAGGEGAEDTIVLENPGNPCTGNIWKAGCSSSGRSCNEEKAI